MAVAAPWMQQPIASPSRPNMRVPITGKLSASSVRLRLEDLAFACPRCCVCASRSGTRITDTLQQLPRAADRYFAERWHRGIVWCWISLFLGYYTGNMVSLAFGALAINDVVAAIVTVGVTEVLSAWYYAGLPAPSLLVTFGNFFKMGVTFAFAADALKLGS